MHHIRKLELVGFKSFCDRTQIVFNEGVTAIVGPNGCGKSNISDAISWVVGEQSAKSLRTDRMEGVIFNGTQARKATSMAEVVLTLNLPNYATLPEGLDIDPAHFTVGRRLYRSGESEYSLDGRRCRLKDIQALFEGTGLGPNSYALMEQGRIGQILSSKPADRRSLIEEAARITLFKSRRYSAESKLEMARQNLLRVHDIIREVERQLGSLKRQAAKARRYSRLREELRGLLKLRFAMERRDLGAKLEECRARFTAAQEAEQAILAGIAEVEARRVAAQEACRRSEEVVARVRDELGALQLAAERARSAAESQRSQRAGQEERARQLALERQAIEERSALVERERIRVTQLLGSLAEEIEREQARLETEQERGEALLGVIRRTESAIDACRSFLLSGAGRLADLRNAQVRSQEGLERIEGQAARLAAERDARGSERAALEAELASLRARAGENEATRGELVGAHQTAEERAAVLARQLEECGGELAALGEEHSLMQHRYSSLEEVEHRRSNYSEGVQKFLSTHLPGEEPRTGQTLADHVETDTRYETAVEDYLNEPLQYILVEGLDEAVSGVDRLRRIGAGKCTFLAMRTRAEGGNGHDRPALAGDGVIGYLDDLLRMRPDVKLAFERALPEYASTVMVDDLETAFRVAEGNRGASFLTLAGEAYSPRGTLSAVGERKSMSGFLALKREMRELSQKLGVLKARIEEARQRQARLKAEQAAELEAIKSLGARVRTLEVDAVGLRHELGRLESESRKAERAEALASEDLGRLAAERLELEAKRAEAAAAVVEIEARSRSGEEELRELTVRLDGLRAESAGLQRSLGTLQSAHAVRQERRSTVESELGRLGGEAEELRGRLDVNRSEAESALERARALEAAERESRESLERLSGEVAETEAGLLDRQRDLAAERDRLAADEAALGRLHQEREAAMGVRGGVEIEKTRMESGLEHLERGAFEEFHAPLAELAEGVAAEDWARDYGDVCRNHEEVRERVESFGAINMRALEEYQELDQRHQFLAGQRADIEQSIADTEKAIAEINRRSIEQFQDAFAKIRENFIQVFQILFQGGQCDLRLLDEADVLESGVDIIAQPPGKRLQNVLLLSGGEKALTALALLIAIFRYRPSPFCVLDEVDAPLDDANIHRFTNLVSELSKETQFIVITHNKRTMETAETLYGVTMEEPGISKILSVDFRRHQALAS